MPRRQAYPSSGGEAGLGAYIQLAAVCGSCRVNLAPVGRTRFAVAQQGCTTGTFPKRGGDATKVSPPIGVYTNPFRGFVQPFFIGFADGNRVEGFSAAGAACVAGRDFGLPELTGAAVGIDSHPCPIEASPDAVLCGLIWLKPSALLTALIRLPVTEPAWVMCVHHDLPLEN